MREAVEQRNGNVTCVHCQTNIRKNMQTIAEKVSWNRTSTDWGGTQATINAIASPTKYSYQDIQGRNCGQRRWKRIQASCHCSKESTANAITKRIHQVPGNLLRIFDLDKVDLDEGNPWDEFLAATTFAIRSTVTNTICFTSSACMWKGYDLPPQCKTDWATITLKKQKRIDKSNRRENSKRISMKYKEGNLVLHNIPGILPKLVSQEQDHTWLKRYMIIGTVTIARSMDVTDRVNIRRL